MIDLAHEEVLAFLALLAFGNVLCGADEAHDLSLRPGTLEIGKSMILHPADLAVSPPDPVLDREGLRIDGIKSRRDRRPSLRGGADRTATSRGGLHRGQAANDLCSPARPAPPARARLQSASG